MCPDQSVDPFGFPHVSDEYIEYFQEPHINTHLIGYVFVLDVLNKLLELFQVKVMIPQISQNP